MVDLVALGPWAAAISGVLYAVLGLGLVLVRPRRPHTVAFGAFALLWGFEIALANVTRVTSGLVAQRSTFLFLAFLVVLPVPLAFFASAMGRRGFFTRSWAGAAVLLAPSAAGAVMLVFAPETFHRGRSANGLDEWGPLFPVYATLFLATFGYAFHTMRLRLRDAETAVEGKRTLLVLVSLGIFVAYASAESVILFGAPLLEGSLGWQGATFFAVGLLGTALLLVVGRDVWRRPLDYPRGRLALVLGLPFVFGLVSGATGASLDSVGIWRTGSVLLIAYAILRFELFDLDVKVKRGAIAASILLLATALAVGVEQGLARVLQPSGVALTTAQFALFGGVVLVGLRAPRLARALGDRVLPGLHAPGRLDARRLDVYEAALAQAAAGPGIEKEDELLRELRQSLGVSEAEHDLLARLVTRAPAIEAARIEAGVTLADRYRLVRLLGEGSTGAAWLAHDERSGGLVVVKALHASLARNAAATRAFLREARLAASLDHPHVVRVLGHGSAGERPFLVLEHVAGGTLEERLGAPLPPALARRLAVEILSGLAHVHARGILHRDLKPANVLLDPEGTAKITDFGVALETGVDETVTGLEAPQPKGTLATMSPENVRGLPLTPASDVYAVGAILYRMAAGTPYLRLEGRSREGARAAILTEPPLPAPPGTDAVLLKVALRALEKDPAGRFASADEMRRALEPIVVTLTPDAPARSSRRRAS